MGAVVGGAVAWFLFPKQHSNILENVGMSETEGERQAREKEERKRKILELLLTQGSLTNNQVENLLGVSDATATRYLEELEEEGKIKQVGEVGRGVHYLKAD